MAIMASSFTVVADEEELRAIAADDELVCPGYKDFMRTMAYEFTAKDVDGEAPYREKLSVAASVEAPLRSVAEYMAGLGEDLRRGAAAAAFAEEPEVAEAMLAKAAVAEDLRGEAAAFAVNARRMVEEDVLVAAADRDLADPGTLAQYKDASRMVMEGMVDQRGPSPLRAASAAIAENVAVAMADKMAELARKLRRGAAAFFDGEDDVVEMLLDKARAAEEIRAEAEAAAALLRRYRLSGENKRRQRLS